MDEVSLNLYTCQLNASRMDQCSLSGKDEPDNHTCSVPFFHRYHLDSIARLDLDT